METLSGNDELDRAIKHFKTGAGLAAAIGMSRQAVSDSVIRGRMSYEQAFKTHKIAPQFRVDALTTLHYKDRKAS